MWRDINVLGITGYVNGAETGPVVLVWQTVKAAGPGATRTDGAFALHKTRSWSCAFEITLNPVDVSARWDCDLLFT